MTQGLLADAVTLRATGIDTNIFQENTKYANVNISGRRSHYISTPPKNPQKSLAFCQTSFTKKVRDMVRK